MKRGVTAMRPLLGSSLSIHEHSLTLGLNNLNRLVGIKTFIVLVCYMFTANSEEEILDKDMQFRIV